MLDPLPTLPSVPSWATMVTTAARGPVHRSIPSLRRILTATAQTTSSRANSSSSRAPPPPPPSSFDVVTPSGNRRNNRDRDRGPLGYRPSHRGGLSPSSSSSSSATRSAATAKSSRYGGQSAIGSNALHQVRAGLAAQDLDAVWEGRKALLSNNQNWRLVGHEARDTRNLIVRIVTDKNNEIPKPRVVDPIECAQVLVAEALELAVNHDRNASLAAWLPALISMDRAEMAEQVAHTYFERKVFQGAVSVGSGRSAPSKDKASTSEAAAVEAVRSEDSPPLDQRAQEDGMALADPFDADTTAAAPRPLPPRSIPLIVNEILLILVHLHVKRYGDISRLLPLLRNLPHQDRSKLVLVHSSRKYRETFAMLDRAHGTQQPSQGFERAREDSLHIAELMWGIRRPKEEIGRDPIGRLFGSLAAKRHIEPMARLLDAFTMAVGRHWIWMKDTPRSRQSPPSPDISQSTWAVIIAKLLSVNQNHLATKVWERFHSLGLPVNAAMYNALLLGYSTSAQWDALHTVWAEHASKKDEGRPDIYTYTTMILALFRSKNPAAAINLFEELKMKASDDRNLDRARLRPGIKTYNVVLHGLLYNGRYQDATDLLQKMLDPPAAGDKLTPRAQTTTLNTMMRAYARAGNLPALSSLLSAMQGWKDVEPDIITFTTVLDALVRHGPPRSAGESVRSVSQLMRDSNVEANTISWSALIKAMLSNTGSAGSRPAYDSNEPLVDAAHVSVKLAQITAALHAVEEMLSTRVFPNEVTLGSLIQASAQFQRHLEELELGDVEQYTSPLIYDETPAIRQQTQSLAAIPEIGETTSSLDQFKRARVGSALALSFFEEIQSRYKLFPNRKTFHFILEHTLRSTPVHHPSPTVGWLGELEASRLAFVRGLAILDDFSTQLLTHPLGQGRPVAEGISGLRLPPYLLEPLPTLRPLTPLWKAPPPQAPMPAMPNTLSMQILFAVLGQRLEVLLAIRDSPIYLGQQGASSSPPMAIRNNVDNQIHLTQNALAEVINRYKVWSRLRAVAERQMNAVQPDHAPKRDNSDESISDMIQEITLEEREQQERHLAAASQDANAAIRQVAERAIKVLEVTQTLMRSGPKV